jgi:hypothetical protein
MAKEQWKKVGALAAIVSILLVVAGIVWAGGGRVTGVEKDISHVKENAIEDREAIKNVSILVTALKDKQDKDYRELKDDAHRAEVRDERQATQYTAILSHMERQTAHVKKTDESIQKIQEDVTTTKVKVNTLIQGK